jgi:hypothetical protein
MTSLELSDPLPKPIAEVLVELVKRARRDQTLDVLCFIHTPDDVRYYISIGDDEGDEVAMEIPKGDPVTSLEKLGYLVRQDQAHVFLLPTAFRRADYERKNRLSKWLARTIDNGRDVLLAISFVLSLLLMLKELFFS